MATREEYTFFAKLSEQAERYEDMITHTSNIVRMSQATNTELSMEERNLLSVAYKNTISSKRQAIRQIDYCLQQADFQPVADSVVQYRQRVLDELTKTCNEILQWLKAFLTPTATRPDAKTFYLKMEGDYHRYLAEFGGSPETVTFRKDAETAYSQAQTFASQLPALNPVRLGLALNFSVFYFEVQKEKETAINLARESYQQANDAKQRGECDQESDQILALIYDNLRLWQGCDSQAAEQDGTHCEDL